MMKNYNFSNWRTQMTVSQPCGKNPSNGRSSRRAVWNPTVFLSFLLAFFLAQEISAQASLYTFGQSNSTYSAITGGTVVATSTAGTPNLDSFVSSAITIPSFAFAGALYTTMYVTANGQVSLGTTVPTTSTTVLSSAVGGNVFLAPFSADLDDNTGVSEIRYQMIGDEVVVQWTNFRRYARTESFNFQARMNTVTGLIKFVYDGTPPYDTSTVYQPQVGIKSGVGFYNALTVAATGDWNAPVNITTGLVAGSVASFRGNVGPTSGLTYTWTPNVETIPNCVATFFPADLATTVDRNITLTWTSGGANPTSYDIYLGTSASPPLVTTVTETSYTPAVLLANTTYYWKVVTKNTAGDAVGCIEHSFTTGANIAYCTPSSTLSTTFINNFSTSLGTTNISNASGYTTGGYQDNFSATAVTSVPTGSFNFNMAITGGTVGAAIWVDWNSNGVFETTERVFVTTGYNAGPFSGTISIPASTPPGDYRMRAMIDFNSSVPSNPCMTANTRTETEDYKITVVAQSGCSGTPAAATIASSLSTICVSGTVTLTATLPSTTDAGFTYQWYNTSGAISGATAATFTTPTLSAPESYYFRNTCTNSGLFSDSNTISIAVTSPQVLSTIPASRCGQGVVELSATASTGATLEWFATETGGTSLATGTSFTTPSISSTTTYYVEANEGGTTLYGGKPTTNQADGTNTTGGLYFTANTAFALNSVVMYPQSAGTNTIVLYSGSATSGTPIYTKTYTFTGAVPSGVTVPLNWNITPGNYTIYQSISNANCVRDLASALPATAYPYNIGAACSITGPTLTGNYYYFFYNWSISTGCSSARTAVTATVTTPPALTLSSNGSTLCQGTPSNVVTLTAGASDYDTLVWAPANGVTGNATDGFIFNPAATTTYTLTASNAANCVNTATYTVTVNPLPTALTITADATVCASSATMLSVLSGGSINITPINESFATTSFPANWTTQVGTGDAIAVVAGTSSGGTGNQIVITGNSQTALITDRVSYGPINSAGLSTMTLQWNNYLNHYSATYPYSAKIQTSSDGVTWHDTSWSYSPVTASVPVGLQTTTLSTSDIGSSTLYIAFTVEGRTFGMNNWNIDNVHLSGSVTNNVTWSPTTNLFTDAAATTPYSGAPATTVYVKSAVAGSQTYTATSTSAVTGCTTSDTVTVTTTVTDVPSANQQTLCGGSTVADLVATGVDLQWYAASTGGSPLADTALLATGNYYVSQTLNACESERTLVAITVTPSTATITRVGDTLTATEAGATYQWITCDASSTPIAGATDQSYTVTAVGSYAVIVTQNNCSATSECFDVSTLSNNSFDFAKLTYYPNPVTDILTIAHTQTISSVQVYDIAGRLVKQIKTNDKDVQVNMANMPASVYVVKIVMENTTGEFKVVKK